jgi:hypothetical protein
LLSPAHSKYVSKSRWIKKMLKYIDLGADKQLNEVVFAGSHDAGVTEGESHAQTQSLDIFGQAAAGVRFFDVRVAAKDDASNLRSFHAPKAKGTQFSPTGQTLKGASMGSVWGMTLKDILMGAKNFVMSAEGAGEFIFLKFDKCTGWYAIANMCREVLGRNLYIGTGNINTKTLSSLSGKVICAFMTEGYAELCRMDGIAGSGAPSNRDQPGYGITHIKNLSKPPAGYVHDFEGLQYWGAGGTSVMNPRGYDSKTKENVKTQTSRLAKAATGIKDKFERKGLRRRKVLKTTGCEAANPNAMGMMYWTSTGVFGNIQQRDAHMWEGKQVGGLDAIWNAGFSAYFEQVLPGNIGFDFGSGGALKLFMPNIVMIDFSSPEKCEHIYFLNKMAAVQIAIATQKLNEKWG